MMDSENQVYIHATDFIMIQHIYSNYILVTYALYISYTANTVCTVVTHRQRPVLSRRHQRPLHTGHVT